MMVPSTDKALTQKSEILGLSLINMAQFAKRNIKNRADFSHGEKISKG
jgi:hypothetical protein